MKKVSAAVVPGGRIAVLGLSYKSSTNVSDGAFGVLVATGLAERGFAVSAYDPEATIRIPDVHAAAHLSDALAGADAVIVATPWPEFASIDHIDAAVVFDYWRIVPPPALSPGTRVLYPGVGP